MAYPIQTYDDLLNLIKASGRSFDLEQIEHAYQVAAEAHKEQKKKIRRAVHYASCCRSLYFGGTGHGYSLRGCRFAA